MKKVLLSVFGSLLLATGLLAQNETDIQKEIDIQVWKPFHDAFEARDAQALNAIYANEVLRVTPAGVDTKGNFKQLNIENYSKASDSKVALDFWFDSRQSSEDTSYEVGIFKIGITTGPSTTYIYGQFHIVIKKIDGSWKITQDWDSEKINGRPITEKDFARKPALKF